MAAANERFPVKLYPSAVESDVLFYCVVDEVLAKNKAVEYGALFRTLLPHAPAGFDNHRLVYIEPSRADGKQHWYFAADRVDQDDYNWSLGQGRELIRDYLIPRNLYFERTEAEAGVGAAVDEFFSLVVPTLDTRFASYGFADDTVMEAPKELRSRYVVIRRRFIEPITTDFPYDDTLQRHVAITRELIPAGSLTPSTPAAGSAVEVQHGNRFHDVLITRELMFDAGSASDGLLPYELPPYPSTYDRSFPGRLDSVDLIWAWAFADSSGAAESYSEDYYFKFKITEARPGPYSATVRRFITDDPEAIKAAYPINIVPQPITESIAVVGAWFNASTDGNSTMAVAKEWPIPATLHEAITIGYTPDGAAPTVGGPRSLYYTTALAATPGVTAFLALTTAVMDYDVRPLPMGLYEVRVIEVDISNLYG